MQLRGDGYKPMIEVPGERHITSTATRFPDTHIAYGAARTRPLRCDPAGQDRGGAGTGGECGESGDKGVLV
eukprot:2201927-Rhodomonas_salina.3